MLTNEQLMSIINIWDVDTACVDNRLNRTILDLTNPQRTFSVTVEKADYLPKLYCITMYKIDEKKSLHRINIVCGIPEEIELEFNYKLTTRAKNWVQAQLDGLFGDKKGINGFEKLL